MKKIASRLREGALSIGEWVVRNKIVYELLSFLLILGAFYLGVMGGLMILLLTDSPLRSVYSNSMNHYGDNMTWRLYFEKEGIPTSNFPLQEGFARGDLLLIRGVEPEEIKVGDVIVYRSYDRMIVHRVVQVISDGKNFFFVTKGDANKSPDFPPVRSDRVVGKVLVVIPKLGWFSIWWR
jgi:signal peptidase I